MSLITCEDVAFSYDAGTVVHGICFSVDVGDYLCIVGENGSGKSTLMKGLLRLLQPSGGQITFGAGLRRDQIGYLPQQMAVQRDFPASVFEVVLSGRLNSRGLRPFYSPEDRRIARHNMELLDISALEYRCYRELSGGQMQRVLLARALCATDRLLLMDEPVAGLDPLAAREMYQVIAELNRERRITVIMVSHDIHSAIRYASHILHLEHQQAFFGTTEAYLASEAGKRFSGGEKIA